MLSQKPREGTRKPGLLRTLRGLVQCTFCASLMLPIVGWSSQQLEQRLQQELQGRCSFATGAALYREVKEAQEVLGWDAEKVHDACKRLEKDFSQRMKRQVDDIMGDKSEDLLRLVGVDALHTTSLLNGLQQLESVAKSTGFCPENLTDFIAKVTSIADDLSEDEEQGTNQAQQEKKWNYELQLNRVNEALSQREKAKGNFYHAKRQHASLLQEKRKLLESLERFSQKEGGTGKETEGLTKQLHDHERALVAQEKQMSALSLTWTNASHFFYAQRQRLEEMEKDLGLQEVSQQDQSKK